MAATPRKAALRAVGPDEKPATPRKRAPRKVSTLSQAVKGTRRQVLDAARANAAATLDDSRTNPTAKAALFRTILTIDAEIRAIELEQERKQDDSAAPDQEWDPEAL